MFDRGNPPERDDPSQPLIWRRPGRPPAPIQALLRIADLFDKIINILAETMTAKPPRLLLLDAVAIITLALGSLISIAALMLKPTDQQAEVAVIFPPWVSKAEAIVKATQAGARLVGLGRYPFILIVMPEALDQDDHSDRDYKNRALEQGALMVANPHGFGGCFMSLLESTAP
jgi:hypothetical protein